MCRRIGPNRVLGYDPLRLDTSIQDKMNPSKISELFCAMLTCCVLAACDKSAASKSSGPVPVANRLMSALAAESARQPTAPPVQNPRDFGAMFENEAAHRPTGTIRAEDAMEAFRQDGVELETVRQHLGRPYGARYCVGAKSGKAVALSVCEYIDVAAAAAGAEVSRKLVLANREILINQATSLTVRELEKTGEADAVAKKLFERFAKLHAPLATK